MSIRTRLSLWYAAVMFIALMATGILLYNLLVIEPRPEARRYDETYRQVEPADPDIFEDVAGIVLWCVAPAALLAMAGGWWLMHRSLEPVLRLTETMEDISEHNLNERLRPAGSGDELDRLTEVFNRMLGRLDDSFHRIREFTLHASHELKTPLTVLRGETEIALGDEKLPRPERERLVSQLDELQRLTRIVDGLTLLAKADAGQVALNLEPVRLDELVRDNFADAKILAEPHGLAVNLIGCGPKLSGNGGITVRGDRHRLRQLLLNLTDNAVKYNRPEGGVMMKLQRLPDMAEFTIANTGPGIPSEALPRIFDRFFRGDRAHSNEVDGCGLGLSIAKWIVSAHHGIIQIESAPSQLTTVIVRLPLLT